MSNSNEVVRLAIRGQAKCKEGERLWETLIQSDCSGVLPHQSLSTCCPGVAVWAAQKHYWADGLQSANTKNPRERSPRQQGLWALHLTYLRSRPLQINLASPHTHTHHPRDVDDCLNRGPPLVRPSSHLPRPLLWGVGVTERPGRTTATSIQLMNGFQG